MPVPGWSTGTVFRANTTSVNKPGYAIYLENNPPGTVVKCDNIRTDPGSLSNLGCTP
jgi:hypothetical protein